MSDEIASATLQTSQKAIEVALELIKMLAPLAQKLLSEVYHKSVDGINDVGGKIANARSLGTVSAKNLVVEAQKANSPISTTSNFLARDTEQIAAKAKQYKMPILRCLCLNLKVMPLWYGFVFYECRTFNNIYPNLRDLTAKEYYCA